MRRVLLFAFLVVFALPHVATAQVAGPIGSPVVFSPKSGTMLTLEGRGPFRGSLEVRREGANVTVVNTLNLDHYVMGVREVPGTWPMEALKAQAVAARTYALWEIDKGYWKRFGFDVCATTSCQVYQGATAEKDERGERWVAAVRATAGEVLLDAAGKPALTRYHSTSGGRTLNNELVYPSDGARPYLKGVEDTFDKVSPLHTWTVRFEREHMQAIMREAIGLQGELTEMTTNQNTREVLIKTRGGQLEISTVRMRRTVSEAAPKLFPAIYPARRSDGERMPFTLPSSRFSIERTDDGFLIKGRGYGHGVGMSQYGAMGRAKAGHSYEQILGAYYGGLQPSAWEGVKQLRVAVVRGIGSARVTGDGVFGVTTNGQTLAASTIGGWAASSSGVRSISLSPPQGHALPLALTGVRVADEIIVDPPEHEDSVDVGFVVPKPAEVTGVVTRDGEEVARRRIVVEAGEQSLSIPLDPEKLARKAIYQLTIEAHDGTERVRSEHDVTLVRPRTGLWWKVGLTLALVAGLLSLRRRQVRIRAAGQAPSAGAPGVSRAPQRISHR